MGQYVVFGFHIETYFPSVCSAHIMPGGVMRYPNPSAPLHHL